MQVNPHGLRVAKQVGDKQLPLINLKLNQKNYKLIIKSKIKDK